jgi:hypothetical protein
MRTSSARSRWVIARVRKEELDVDAALEFFNVLLFSPLK